MSPLICFLNKLVEPDPGILSELTLASGGPEAAGNSATGEPGCFISLGASCSVYTGKEDILNSVGTDAGECGKIHSLWASEDMTCGLERTHDIPASRSPNAVDSQRAVSLDTECISDIIDTPGTSLVRSAALEDLTAIGTKISWADSERPISNVPMDNELALNYLKTLPEVGSLVARNMVIQQIIPESPESCSVQDLSCYIFGSGTSLPEVGSSTHPSDLYENISLVLKDNNRIGISADLKRHEEPVRPDSKTETDLERVSHISLADVDNHTGVGNVIPVSKAIEFQRTSQSSPSRKSLVPVAIAKGLFAIQFTNSERVLFSYLLPL